MAFDPAPISLDIVTSSEWLTTVLRQRWPGVQVNGVETVELLVTQATKVRLALDLTGGDADTPRAICIKGILTPTGAPASASLVETRFYRDLAAHLPIRTPPCIHAGFNADSSNGVIVMHDVKVAGATFLSALSPVTAEEARDSIEQLATLHAAAWVNRAGLDFAWVPRFLDQIGAKPIMPTAMLQDLLDGPRGAPLPAAIRDAGRLERAIGALAAQGHQQPAFLVHGDAHAGNIYRDADGIGIVDWQVFQQGEWALDVAYHIGAVLSVEDRRLHERALLDLYRDRLAALGGPRIGAEEGWTRYRLALIYGYYMWAITRKVDPPVILEFVKRLGLAVADLDSMTLIEG